MNAYVHMETYGLCQKTIQFAEFVLRKEHEKIFIIATDFGHQIRLANLYDGLLEYPYPEENVAAVINSDFYADAKKFSGAAKRSK